MVVVGANIGEADISVKSYVSYIPVGNHNQCIPKNYCISFNLIRKPPFLWFQFVVSFVQHFLS
jgi:hypothetical protein